MNKYIPRIALMAAALAASTLLAQETARKAEPPMAKKNSKVVTLHGDTLRDDYHWLRDKENPEVKAYLDSENSYTDAVMKDTEELQKKLYDEMLGRIKETDLSVPYRKGDHFYYFRTEKGKQYRIYCRKKGSLEAPEQVTLDLNDFGKDAPFVGLGTLQVSDDANRLAYSIDLTGFREYTLAFKDLRTGATSTDAHPPRLGRRLVRRQQDCLLHDGRPRQAAIQALAPPRGNRSGLGPARVRGKGRDVPRVRVALAQPGVPLRGIRQPHGERDAVPPRGEPQGEFRSCSSGQRTGSMTWTTGATSSTSSSTTRGATSASSPRRSRIRRPRTGKRSSRIATTSWWGPWTSSQATSSLRTGGKGSRA